MGKRRREGAAARPAAFCALRFRPLPWAVLAVAAADPVLLVAGSAPATLLDFPAALGTVGARNSEQGIFLDCAGAGLGPSNLLAVSDTGVVSPCRVTYLLGKVQQMGSVPL